jgi:uncharacterized protein YkwD
MPKKSLLALAAVIAAVAGALVLTAGPGGTSAAAPLDSQEQQFLDLLNQYRQQNSLGTVTIDTRLQDAADWMSNDMGVNDYFSHTDSLGRDPFQRMAAFGYNYNTWKGENIAAGYGTAASVFDAWKNSSGHNANMLNANYKVVGIGRIQVPGSPYGTYWTNDFGGYLAPGTPAPTPPPTPAPTPPPTPAPTSDADADGFTYAVETHLGTNPNDPCGNPNSGLPGSPSNAWPADLSASSPNRVDVTDVATFVVPVRRFDTSPGHPAYNRRWDLVPGRGVLANDINASDLNAVVAAAPAMFAFERAFNGPSCTP